MRLIDGEIGSTRKYLDGLQRTDDLVEWAKRTDAQLEAEARKEGDAYLEEIYRAAPELRPTPQEHQAQALERQARALQSRADQLKRIGHLQRMRMMAEAKLRKLEEKRKVAASALARAQSTRGGSGNSKSEGVEQEHPQVA